MHGIRTYALAVLAVALIACESPGGLQVLKVDRVDVGPAGPVLTVGDTMRLTALPRTVDGTALGSVQITWRSDSEAVAVVRGAGMVEAKAPGTPRISAEAEGRTGWVLVTVIAAPLEVASVEIVPSSVTLVTGQQLPVDAIVRAADGTRMGGRTVTWSSSHGPTATVTADWSTFMAVLSAHSAGTAVIRAAVDGVYGEARVTVVASQQPVHSITLAPADTTLIIGEPLVLTPVLRAADGSVIPGRPSAWTSSDSTVASVDAYGNVRANAVGVATVTARTNSVTATARIAVRTAATPVASVMLLPEKRSLWLTRHASYAETVTLLGPNGLPLPDTRLITWAVEDADVAEIDQTGRVLAKGTGVTHVLATSEGQTGRAQLIVYARSQNGVAHYPMSWDWWDGMFHQMPHMADTVWTDAAGVERTVPLYLWSGSVTLDRSSSPFTYERVLVQEAWATVDGAGQKVAERRIVDTGTFIDLYVFGGSTEAYLLTSTTTPGVQYELKARNPGELMMKVTNADGRQRDVLFRLQQ